MTKAPHSHNNFSMEYYASIIKLAQVSGYSFCTLSEFVRLGCPKRFHFVIRHDLDRQPMSLRAIFDTERELNVRSTTFVRLAGAEYNVLSYPCFKMLSEMAHQGWEIGLHSNFVEYAVINNLSPEALLMGELNMLRTFFDVVGVAPHRDINYMYNSLPFLNENWQRFSKEMNLSYHAYEDRILSNTMYVNEGFNPHICWRSITPEEAVKTGGSVYMLTHPHWWYKEHAFEEL